MSKDTNGTPEDKSNERVEVRVTGAIVLVTLEDGSMRQAHINQVEHMRTIINICSMNEQSSLILGGQDFSPVLGPYFTQDEPSPSP